jgi:hypothetical protein
MNKLSHMLNGEWTEHSHPPTYMREELTTGVTRLKAGLPLGEIEVLRKLLLHMEQPIYILYILHTPRGEGDPGRYQSSELSVEAVEHFLVRFSNYLQKDARFDLWFHSPSSSATVVWDRHNILFAYGLLEEFEAEIQKHGFSQGEPLVPVPHTHHYREACDADATALLSHFDWHKSGLREEDEQ